MRPRTIITASLGVGITAGVRLTDLGWLIVISPDVDASRHARRRCLLAVDAEIDRAEAGLTYPSGGVAVVRSFAA